MKFRDKPKILSEEEKTEKEDLANKILHEADEPATFKVDKKAILNINPWELIKGVKETNIFSFRIPKKEMQKLKYISKETCMSINTLCLRAVSAYNKKIISDLKKE